MKAARLKLLGQAAAVGVVAGLLILLVWKVAGGSDSEVAGLDRGETPPAPAFTLERLDREGELSLAAYRGKAVVLNFWASWCVPCKAEAPRLEAASRKWAGQGVVFLGVDANDFGSDGRRFVDKHGISYLNLEDGSGSSIGRWGVTGFPETFFIDREGRAVDHVAQEIDASEIEDGIRKAIS
jgi:cytochrome c biogenesis protein CcmG, thiol:disulfide interchange protein DsbE